MGDPAGIGPEIVVGTMLSEEIHECCKPFVIGSKAIMELSLIHILCWQKLIIAHVIRFDAHEGS